MGIKDIKPAEESVSCGICDGLGSMPSIGDGDSLELTAAAFLLCCTTAVVVWLANFLLSISTICWFCCSYSILVYLDTNCLGGSAVDLGKSCLFVEDDWLGESTANYLILVEARLGANSEAATDPVTDPATEDVSDLYE